MKLVTYLVVEEIRYPGNGEYTGRTRSYYETEITDDPVEEWISKVNSKAYRSVVIINTEDISNISKVMSVFDELDTKTVVWAADID